MPLSYDIDAERQLMTVTGSGHVSREDVIEHQRQVSSDPRVTPGLRVLGDMRHVVLDMAGREVMTLARDRGDFPTCALHCSF